jgi:hypothetical protein
MKYLFLVVNCLLPVVIASAQEKSSSTRSTAITPAVTEKQIAYPAEILRHELDLQLTPVSEGKFEVNIASRSKGLVFIKVYDVIGNLLHEEKVRVRGTFQQVLDLSDHASKFFIIEVGNDEFNMTKSIVAI